nr:MAG TPA: homing endonuclease [Caudoviricetes sp.]
MEEIWKDIPGYEGYYKISNCGVIISVPRNGTVKSERVLKQYRDKYGYVKVILQKDGVKKNKYVHQLVAITFLKNQDDYPCINHKDENKTNNCINNLEFCTQHYNNNYGTRNERISKHERVKINQYDLQGTFIKTWDGFVEIKETLNIDVSGIIRCCQKQYKTSNGYIWRYADK